MLCCVDPVRMSDSPGRTPSRADGAESKGKRYGPAAACCQGALERRSQPAPLTVAASLGRIVARSRSIDAKPAGKGWRSCERSCWAC